MIFKRVTSDLKKKEHYCHISARAVQTSLSSLERSQYRLRHLLRGCLFSTLQHFFHECNITISIATITIYIANGHPSLVLPSQTSAFLGIQNVSSQGVTAVYSFLDYLFFKAAGGKHFLPFFVISRIVKDLNLGVTWCNYPISRCIISELLYCPSVDRLWTGLW